MLLIGGFALSAIRIKVVRDMQNICSVSNSSRNTQYGICNTQYQNGYHMPLGQTHES